MPVMLSHLWWTNPLAYKLCGAGLTFAVLMASVRLLGGRVKSPVSVKSHPRAWAHPIRKKSPQFVKNHPWSPWSMKSAWAHHVRKHSIIRCFVTIHWAHAGDMDMSFLLNTCLNLENTIGTPSKATQFCLAACTHISTNAVRVKYGPIASWSHIHFLPICFREWPKMRSMLACVPSIYRLFSFSEGNSNKMLFIFFVRWVSL